MANHIGETVVYNLAVNMFKLLKRYNDGDSETVDTMGVRMDLGRETSMMML